MPEAADRGAHFCGKGTVDVWMGSDQEHKDGFAEEVLLELGLEQ